MGQKIARLLSVRAPLDTANPLTDRSPGTLIEATDVATRWWGPRDGAHQFAGLHAMTAGDLVGPAPGLVTFDGTDDVISGDMNTDEQRNLPTQWTADVVFRATSITPASEDTIFVFRRDSSNRAFRIYIDGGDGDKIKAVASTSTVTNTLDGGTVAVAVGSGPEHIHHVRLLRDRADLFLIMDGVLIDSSSVFGTDASNGTADEAGTWHLGANVSATFFQGQIFRAMVRTGKQLDITAGHHDFQFPRHPSVRLAVNGTEESTGSLVCRDFSRFEAHGDISGTPTTAPSVIPPHQLPVQGLAPFSDHNGVAYNAVYAGGRIYVSQVL